MQTTVERQNNTLATAYPAYDSYKDSGVDWLGEVPESWEMGRIANFFSERRQKVSDKDFAPLSVTKLGIFPQWENVAKSNDSDNRKLVLKGDFVINSRSDRKGSSGIAKEDGSVSLINIVLAPQQIEPRFSEYLFKSYTFIEEFYRVGHGIVADLWTTRFDDIKNSLIAFPCISTQAKIADFLDQKTTQIDQAIALKQQQIDKLNEYKQIVIQNAVTKGLNPDAPMKDSGVEWIGEIPEHWDVKKLKFLTKIFRGKFTHRPRNDPALYDGKYPFFQTGDVAKADKFLFDYKQTLNERGLKVSTLIPKGTVLITIAANIGDVAILDIDACFPDSIVGFEPVHAIKRDMLFYTLLVMKEIMMKSSIQNTQMNLNVERIGNQFLCLASIDEQLEIISFIKNQSKKINQSIQIQQSQINHLQEYKTVLINQAVTGKIKV